jgi:cell division protein FtsI/penicillin-binding protein 2
MKLYQPQKKKNFNRLKFLIIVISVFSLVIFTKLFFLQILRGNFYKKQAESFRYVEKVLPAKRGSIKDSKGEPLAFNIESYFLYAVPAAIKSPEDVAKSLAPFLGIQDQKSSEFENLKARLSKPRDFYEVLKKNLTLEEANEIKELALPGVVVEKVFRRYYPEAELFSQVIGYVGVKDNSPIGQYGIEEFFEKELAGQPAIIRGEKSAGNTLILGSSKIIQEAIDGSDIVLTIDKVIQHQACQYLKEGIIKSKAKSGSIVFLAPQTGAVLALCSWPSFDPNHYSETKDYKLFTNPITANSFEPGSVFKVITMASALDLGVVGPETTYVDSGEVKIGGHVIKNAEEKIYGEKTMTNVLEKSINTGAVFAAQKVGQDLFRAYVKAFGFGSLTEIEQPNEALGNIRNLEEKNPIYLATASFGQGLSVTPIQLVTAIGAIANQGKLMKPYLVDRIVKSNGQVYKTQPKLIRQVIKPETATILTAMMVSTLENGYGKLARVAGYYIAGKTGTAQAPKPGGGYSEETIHSLVGFGPADNPAFVGLVKIDQPQVGRFAESTAAPVFGRMADFLLKYYNIPPNR